MFGSDSDNLILTRRVQRDIWLHQHPRNCSHPSVRFLVADVHSPRGAWFGVGAELNMMAGILSRAIKEGRVLVIRWYERANHDLCRGMQHSLVLSAWNSQALSTGNSFKVGKSSQYSCRVFQHGTTLHELN